jgi:Sulfate permease family
MERALFLSRLDDRWPPKSVLCLRDYSLNKFLHDLVAGVTVGLVALPLAMAFAIASGLTPQAGIYCALVTGLVISALGRVQDADRRADGRFRCGDCRDRCRAWRGWVVHVHGDGWHPARDSRRDGHGQGGEIHSPGRS